jgi:hypothetical protein
MIGRMDDPAFLHQVGEFLEQAEGMANIVCCHDMHPWECHLKSQFTIHMGVSAYVDLMFWLREEGEDVEEAQKRGAAFGQN